MSGQSHMSCITPIVPVNDRVQSRDFYTRLGFEVVFDSDGYVILKRDGIAVHLTWSEGWYIDPQTNNTQFRVGMTDMDDFHALCQTLDVIHPNGPLEEKPWGSREFTILDPDNACITFYEDPAG